MLRISGLFFLACSAWLSAATVWTIRVEEPTGLYPRTNEVMSVAWEKLAGPSAAYQVIDANGHGLPSQAADTALLFPVSLIPGELPEFKVVQLAQPKPAHYVSQIHVKKIGMHRLELGNRRFRVLIDSQIPAILEAYSLTAGPQRSLNYVETTPENEGALKGDIHEATQSSAGTVAGVAGDNSGWTSLGGGGPMQKVEIIESGPLRGRVRLSREGETWEFTWTAESGALRWKAARGFRFAAISAEPYLPFDRFVDGSEYLWPTGPDDDEPPTHAIGSRPWTKFPGGHGVYYSKQENYGALGIVVLDEALAWAGIGTRRLEGKKDGGDTEVAITFPVWQRNATALEARRENRLVRQPVLINVSVPHEEEMPVIHPASTEPETEIQAVDAAPEPFTPGAISLNGEWELAWSEKGAGQPNEGWRTVKVPGSVHTQWLEAAKIYTKEAEWISSREWWYRKQFKVPDHFNGKRLRLQFEATDYYADCWLNGRLLGRHEGYIDPYEYDATEAANIGVENEILVRVWTPVHYYWKHRPYTIKGAYGGVDQKPDDITPLGITRAVRLAASEAVIIKDVAIDTRLGDNHSAEVEVQVELDGALEEPVTCELTLSPRNFEAKDIIRARQAITGRKARVIIPVKNPRLWWTWDHGKPNLYTLDIRLLDAAGRIIDAQSLPVGIREIERVGWTFYLNRKRMFIRGTNYYYHLFLSEMDRAAYERDLRLMLDMNVNMIRLHCHFSNREFYELADEQGVMIWQDYLEAWYPPDRRFSWRAAELYDPLIRYARNHPSVISWTTSDEEDLENYRDLTKHLAPRPAFLDPQRRPIVRSTGRYGDAHVYHGWYGGSIWEYTQMDEKFVSELGATSLPNYETLVKFMPDQWPIKDHAEEWMWRRLQIPEAMRAWGSPEGMTMREYIPQTQAYVAQLFQIALERMRRLKYHDAGGILHFHAIDIWPSVTMAAIDFDRKPTKAFYTVQRSFAPVAALFEYDRDQWREGQVFACGLWAANDRWEAVPEATVRWRVLDANKEVRKEGEWKKSLTEDSVEKLGRVEWLAEKPGQYELHAEVADAKGQRISENVFEFRVVDR